LNCSNGLCVRIIVSENIVLETAVNAVSPDLSFNLL
jgi:hypothetical protein